jgi:small subunit ribosomal protein S8
VSKKPVGNKNMHQSTSIDFIIRIKNGYKAGRKTILAPASNFCIAIAELLKKTGFIASFSVNDDVKKEMTIKLAYDNNEGRVSDVRLFSKPGRRIYEKNSSLPWGKSPKSLIIVSTSSGVMSQKEAKVKGLGGEIIAEIW